MRIIIKIPDTMLHKLDIAEEKRKCSWAAITREAIDVFLDPNIVAQPILGFMEKQGQWRTLISRKPSQGMVVTMKAVFDTCILIDFLWGIEHAKQDLHRYEHWIKPYSQWKSSSCLNRSKAVFFTTRSLRSLESTEGHRDKGEGILSFFDISGRNPKENPKGSD